jgi:hypothetical protein
MYPDLDRIRHRESMTAYWLSWLLQRYRDCKATTKLWNGLPALFAHLPSCKERARVLGQTIQSSGPGCGLGARIDDDSQHGEVTLNVDLLKLSPRRSTNATIND